MIINEPLVSIGVPTFNRPLGLKATLNAILSQDYQNIEVIVSDNCSSSYDVKELKKEFETRDSRVKFFIQEENKGALFNFYFVQKQAKGEYFMWASDDDEWQGNNFLSSLMKFAPHNILTFSNAVITNNNTITNDFLGSYNSCKTQIEYIKNFSIHDEGYPIYGVYNLKLFYEYGLNFTFDEDMPYHADGIFLHKIFLAGPVKFVNEASIKFNAYGSLPSKNVLLDCWIKYINRTVLLYTNASIDEEDKSMLIKNFINKGVNTYKYLLEEVSMLNHLQTSQKTQVNNSKLFFVSKFLKRIKSTIKFLFLGRL